MAGECRESEPQHPVLFSRNPGSGHLYRNGGESMNIKDFTYITAVVDCGSYSKAAEALYISQPSLSAYIRNLEKQLDIRFFENDRTHLTPAGEIYVSYAREIIALDRQLSDELARLKRENSGQIRIGITPGRSDQYLDILYDALNTPGSLYRAEFSVDTSEHLVKDVLGGRLDLILINAPQSTQGLICRTVFTDHLLLAVSSDSPVTKLAYAVPGSRYLHLPAEVLGELSYVLFPQNRSMRQTFDAVCEQLGIHPRIVQEIPSVRSACRLVSRGVGATLLFDIPEEIQYLGENASCYYVDLEELGVDFVAAYDKNRPVDRSFRAVIQTICDELER